MMGVAALCALAPGAAWAQDDAGATTPPSITGAASIGQTLGVNPGTTERKSPNTTTYEWRRCAPGGSACPLVGAGDRYTVSSSDAGHVLVVTQVITWPNKKQTVLRSAPTATIGAPPAPVPTPPPSKPVPTPTPTPPTPPTAPSLAGAPEILGAAQGGQTLVADPGTWSSALPMTLSYQWRRCEGDGGSCSGVDGATSRTYTLDAADVGSRLVVVVIARSAAGTASGTSAPTAVVRPAAAQGSFDQTPNGGDGSGSGSGDGGQPGGTPQPAPPGSPAGPTAPRRLAPVVVRFAGSFSGRATAFKLVSVRVPARATLQVRCVGSGCATRARKARLRSGVTRLRWLERRYRPGTSIELRVSRSGRIGAYTRVVIRRGAAPQRRDACLRPGDTRPTACPGR